MAGAAGQHVAETFEAFYLRTWPRMAKLGAALTGHVEVGEDLAQDAFLRVRERFERLENPEAYLRRTLVNLVKTDATATSRRRARERRTALDAASSLRHDRNQVVLDAMRRLSVEQRSVLVLRYWADWPDSTIAEVLGCRRATIRSHVRRGIARLKHELRDEG